LVQRTLQFLTMPAILTEHWIRFYWQLLPRVASAALLSAR
jgi:hypothetical protein